MKFKLCMAAGIAAAFAATAAMAEITIGISIGATGTGASLGVHHKNAWEMMPKTLGGEPVRFIVLENASEATNANKNARKLVTEDKVDALVGSNGVPQTQQIAQVAAETGTPMLALSPVSLAPDKLRWTFIVPQPTELMMEAVAKDIKKRNIKTVAFIGFSDGWGDLVLSATESQAAAAGYRIVANERYARPDTSVTGQVLKIISVNPDAVVVGGAGTGGALPQIALRERGYKGPIYHNHGTVNAEFIKVGGKSVDGAIAPTGPVVVADELPAGYATKAIGMDFMKRYEARFNVGRNAFAGYSYDAYLLLDAAVPAALKKARPGTPEFRAALRDALENVKNVVGTHAVYMMSPSNHNGMDDRAAVLVNVVNGQWKLMK
ncbi:MAG: ABC transporter substrate-binding protein [Betaproteobacteria bacterium]|nr:ABC transporter substrate-binding protein [Betaproteobacteria bacterium]